MTKGIVLYNSGTGCLARLTVAAYSLRQHYSGSIAILSEGLDCHSIAKAIANDKQVNAQFIDVTMNVPDGKNRPNLCKTSLNTVTPYDVTVFIDADTLCLGDMTPVIDAAEAYDFVTTRFSTWVSDGPMMSRRITEWADICPELIQPALAYGPAVNTGVFGFTKKSGLMRDWYDLAVQGRKLFIPDEISCQIMLPKYPHHVVSHNFNCSCRYDNPLLKGVRLIHFHGRKHCRIGLPFHGVLWTNKYREVFLKNIGGIRKWTPAGDRRLKKYLNDGEK